MRFAPDENAPLFSGRCFDLAGDERIHFELYRRQQIDTGLRYMQGDDEAVALQSHRVPERIVFSHRCLPGKRFGCWQGKGTAFP